MACRTVDRSLFAVVELDIFDEQVAAVFGVDAVIVYQLGIVADTPADDVFRFQQVNAPERGVGDEHPFDGDVLAVEELYQLRTQIETLAEVPLLDRCLVVIHVAGQLLSFLLFVFPFRLFSSFYLFSFIFLCFAYFVVFYHVIFSFIQELKEKAKSRKRLLLLYKQTFSTFLFFCFSYYLFFIFVSLFY